MNACATCTTGCCLETRMGATLEIRGTVVTSIQLNLIIEENRHDLCAVGPRINKGDPRG
jgi:hypothetical protein